MDNSYFKSIPVLSHSVSVLHVEFSAQGLDFFVDKIIISLKSLICGASKPSLCFCLFKVLCLLWGGTPETVSGLGAGCVWVRLCVLNGPHAFSFAFSKTDFYFRTVIA